MKSSRCLFLLIAFAFFHINANAQLKPFSFGAYAEALFPTEKDSSNNGFGGGMDFHFKLPVKFTITGSAGFIHFPARTFSAGVKTGETNAIPVRLGFRYRYSVFYAKFESGAIVSTNGDPVNVILSPGIGFKFSAIDLQGKYEVWMEDGDRSFLGVKLAIHF